VPGVLSGCDANPAAEGNAPPPMFVLLALLKLLGVTC